MLSLVAIEKIAMKSLCVDVSNLQVCTFGTGLSYKLSKNHPHLAEFKDYLQLSVHRPARIFPVFNKLNIPCIIWQKSPDSFPVIELSRIDRY